MLPRPLIRTLLTIATFAIVWLVAAPAMAFVGAPICDPHGASAVAPPSQLQESESSLDVDLGFVDADLCAEVSVAIQRGLPTSTSFLDLIATSQEHALSTDPFVLPPSVSERLDAPRSSFAPPRLGVRGTLERPPR